MFHYYYIYSIVFQGRNIITKEPTFTFPLTKLAMSSLLSKTDKVWRRFCSSQSQCWLISSNVAPGLEEKNTPRLKDKTNSQNMNLFSKYHESCDYGIETAQFLTCWTTVCQRTRQAPFTGPSFPHHSTGICECLLHCHTDEPANQSGYSSPLLCGCPASLT